MKASVSLVEMVNDLKQALIRNDDQRIDARFEFFDTGKCAIDALAALEFERLGDNSDSERADFAGNFGDGRSRAGAGAATPFRRSRTPNQHRRAIWQRLRGLPR